MDPEVELVLDGVFGFFGQVSWIFFSRWVWAKGSLCGCFWIIGAGLLY